MRKWFSLLLAVMLLLATMPVLHAEGREIRIDQIYGGGGKEDTPIANSFVELYNPSDNVVELTGYMVTFADNGTILTADEGEPRTGASADDPLGSVSVVRIGQDAALAVQTVYFDEFDAQREALTAAGVLVQKNTMPSSDFEPE